MAQRATSVSISVSSLWLIWRQEYQVQVGPVAGVSLVGQPSNTARDYGPEEQENCAGGKQVAQAKQPVKAEQQVGS